MCVQEQAVVHAHFGVHAVGHAHPGDGGFDLDAVGAGGAALGVGHHGGQHFGDDSVGVLGAAGAFDDVAALQPHLVAGEEALVALGGHFFKVFAFDPDFLADGEVAHGALNPLWWVGQGGQAAGLQVACAHHLVPVGQHQLDGVEHGHATVGFELQVFAQAAFQGAVVDPAVGFGHANAFGKHLQRFGRVATAAQAHDGGHAGVVPAADLVVVHQLGELALAGDDVGEVQARKFVLAGGGAGQQTAFGQALQQPVVEGALVFKLQRAQAVGDLFQRVLNGVRVGVHGVDAPGVARVVVGGAADAVDGRVAHVDVGAGHVDLGAQHHRSVFVLAVAHLAEDAQVFLGRAAAEGAVHAGLAEVAPVGAHLLGGLLVHVGVAGLDQIFGGAVHEAEVVAGLVGRGAAGCLAELGPVKTEPFHSVDDAVDVFGVFFFGVGVVKAQVAHAAVVARQAKVDADALGVADVQVAVGLGREAGADLGGVGLALGVVGGVARGASPAAGGVGALLQVFFDDLAQEVAGLGGFSGVRSGGAGGGIGGGGGAHPAILGGGFVTVYALKQARVRSDTT